MEYKDYYKILGVPKTATDKEIKAAFRKLARKHHPDMNAGNKQAEARFKEINEANEVLSDPEKRKHYDELGANWESYRTAGPRGQAHPGSGGFRVRTETFDPSSLGGFSDFFRTFFGGGLGSQGEGGFEGFDFPGGGRGEIPEYALELTLEEAVKGVTRSLQLGESGKRVEVKIPAGVRDGTRVRAGEVFLRIVLKPHTVFDRKGDDLQASVSVPLTTAVLGGEAKVPTLDGPVGIKVPAGTPAGRVFRLRGHGLPKAERGSGRGDLLASLAVELPKDLSKREREVFEELKRLGR